MSSQEVYRPYGIVFEKLLLTNFDKSQTTELRGVVSEVNIYEDIFQSCIMGDVLVDDTRELIEFFPIIGEETLDIQFRVPTRPDDCSIVFKGMRVYRIGDRTSSGKSLQKQQKYRLYFISPEILTNLNTRVSRSFNTKTADEIVKIIIKEYLETKKEIEVEPAIGTIKMVVPNWNPYKAINWLAENRTKNANDDADFIFYEASDKNKGTKLFFKSLATLAKQEPQFTIEFGVQNLSSGLTKPKYHPTFSRNIEDFQFNKHGNILNNTTSGQYKQHWIFHDPLRKKFVISKPVHNDDFLHEKEGDKKFYSDKAQENANPMQFIRMPGGVNSFPVSIYPSKSLDNDLSKGTELAPLRKNVSYISKRESADELENTCMIPECGYRRSFKIQMINNFSLSIDSIPGTDEIQLGKTVKFNKPHISHDIDRLDRKSGRFNDRYLSGSYLVTRLKHSIWVNSGDPEYSYALSLEIVKDNFEEKISNKNMED